MSLNPLSLSHPSSVEVIDLTHSPVASPPTGISHSPSDYIPLTPEGPPPAVASPAVASPAVASPVVAPPVVAPPVVAPPAVATRRVRAPRRCSVCRQTGHNARNCPDASAVHYRGQTYNVYPNPRDNLIQFVISYFVQRVPQLSSFSELKQHMYQDVFFHVSLMTWNELKGALKNPIFVIEYVRERMIFWIENHRNTQASRQFAPGTPPGPPPSAPRVPRVTGKDYAQNIEVELAPSKENADECFICSDKVCCVTTGCGHEYCADCVSKILYVNKDKTSTSLCSFCKAPFVKLTVSEPSAFTTLCDFIQNLA